jgi:predicted glycosyltransferase
VVPFKGVDEVAWIKDYQPPKKTKTRKPLIVLRQMEIKAAYAEGKHDTAKKLGEQLAELGNVNLLERYNDGGTTYGGKSAFEDSVALVSNADLVVSYGGTISREAALMGVPSIAISDMANTPVNKYLEKKGFPLFITNKESVMAIAKKHLRKHFDVTDRLAALENPVDAILKIAEKIEHSS